MQMNAFRVLVSLYVFSPHWLFCVCTIYSLFERSRSVRRVASVELFGGLRYATEMEIGSQIPSPQIGTSGSTVARSFADAHTVSRIRPGGRQSSGASGSTATNGCKCEYGDRWAHKRHVCGAVCLVLHGAGLVFGWPLILRRNDNKLPRDAHELAVTTRRFVSCPRCLQQVHTQLPEHPRVPRITHGVATARALYGRLISCVADQTRGSWYLVRLAADSRTVRAVCTRCVRIGGLNRHSPQGKPDRGICTEA